MAVISTKKSFRELTFVLCCINLCCLQSNYNCLCVYFRGERDVWKYTRIRSVIYMRFREEYFSGYSPALQGVKFFLFQLISSRIMIAILCEFRVDFSCFSIWSCFDHRYQCDCIYFQVKSLTKRWDSRDHFRIFSIHGCCEFSTI